MNLPVPFVCADMPRYWLRIHGKDEFTDIRMKGDANAGDLNKHSEIRSWAVERLGFSEAEAAQMKFYAFHPCPGAPASSLIEVGLLSNRPDGTKLLIQDLAQSDLMHLWITPGHILLPPIAQNSPQKWQSQRALDGFGWMQADWDEASTVWCEEGGGAR